MKKTLLIIDLYKNTVNALKQASRCHPNLASRNTTLTVVRSLAYQTKIQISVEIRKKGGGSVKRNPKISHLGLTPLYNVKFPHEVQVIAGHHRSVNKPRRNTELLHRVCIQKSGAHLEFGPLQSSIS